MPALSAQGPGNFLRALNCPKMNKTDSVAGIQGTNDASESGVHHVRNQNTYPDCFTFTWVAAVASSFLLKVTKAYLHKINYILFQAARKFCLTDCVFKECVIRHLRKFGPHRCLAP